MPDIAAARPTSGTPIETSWGDQVHDAIEGIQAGYVDIVFAAVTGKTQAVVFPRAYAAPPIVVISIDDTTSSNMLGRIAVGTITANGFTAKASLTSGSAAVSGTVRCYWIAVGTPA